MPIFAWATNVAGSSVAGWLLLWVLKGSLLLALLFPLSALLRRASSSTRHLLWTAGIAIALLLPIMSALLPWRVQLPSAVSAWFAPAARDAGVSVPLSGESRLRDPDTFTPASAAERTSHQITQAPGSTSSSSTTSSLEIDSASPTASVDAPYWTRARVIGVLLFAWLAGAMLLLARLALSRRRVLRLVQGATPLTDSSWTTPLIEVADRLDLPDLPRLVVNADAAMPLTCGITRPAIVLPTEAAQWTDERRRAVLCHELAHVRRRDLLSHMLGRVVCALYWFQPLAWSAARRMRAESERACDDLVLMTGTRASTYADHLLQIVTSVKQVSAPIVALPMAQPREFEARLLSILAPDLKREPLSRVRAASLMVVVLLIALPLIALTPAGSPTPFQNPNADGAAAMDDDDGAEPQPHPRPDAAPQPDNDTQFPTLSQEIERNAEAVAHSIGNERHHATAALSVQELSQDPRVRAALIRALNDSSAEVARSAAWALASHPDTAVVRALIGALRTAVDARVREMAAWAIVEQGEESARTAEALNAALSNDRDAEVRTTAAWGLGNVGNPTALTALERALRTDTSSEVRTAAAWALGQMPQASSIPALNEALTHRIDEVREVAAWSIAQIGPQTAPANLVTALRDSATDVRVIAAWALGRIGDPATTTALRNALNDKETEVRRAVIWAIAMLKGDGAIDALTAALRDGDAEVRAAAAAALGGRGPQMWPWPWPWPMPRPNP